MNRRNNSDRNEQKHLKNYLKKKTFPKTCNFEFRDSSKCLNHFIGGKKKQNPRNLK